MEDDGKLILWGTLVVILLIIIGIINPFLLLMKSPACYNNILSMLLKVYNL